MSQSFNVNSLVSKIGNDAGGEMQKVADLANTMDVTSPADMAKMQMAMMKVSMSFQLQAAMVKDVEDMLKAVVQRM